MNDAEGLLNSEDVDALENAKTSLANATMKIGQAAYSQASSKNTESTESTESTENTEENKDKKE